MELSWRQSSPGHTAAGSLGLSKGNATGDPKLMLGLLLHTEKVNASPEIISEEKKKKSLSCNESLQLNLTMYERITQLSDSLSAALNIVLAKGFHNPSYRGFS